jgi:ABC-type nitrate/sulfonate/bicarbonate transport system substrate-binding protein
MSTSPGIAISAHFEDGNLSIGMVMGLASNLMLIVKPGHTDLLTLKGKRFGVIGTNSDSYRIIKSYLKTKGLDLETDVDLIEIRKPANLLTSFQTDQLDAVVLMSGYAVEAIKSGGEAIISVTDAAEELFGCPAYSTTILVSQKFLERGKVVDKYLRAQREIAQEIEKDPEGAIQIHADFAGEDPEKMRAIFEIITLVCDINPEIEQNIIKYTEYGKSQGLFEEAIGEEIFYDDWT